MNFLNKFCLIALMFIGTSSLFAQSYNSIESVEYDPVNGQFLVSNGSSIIARSPDGTLSYFGDAQANYGMEVMGNILFAIDGSNIRGYDLTTTEEVMVASIPSSGFLNGLTNDGLSRLWATDFSGGKIYEIETADLANPVVTTIVDNTSSTPNGIVYDGANNRLIFANWGNSAPIKAVDLSDNSVSTIVTTPYGNIDGIDEDNDGNYFISTWTPAQIVKYDADFANPEIMSAPGVTQPADICYALPIDTLAIPNGNNTVTFLGFGVIDGTEDLNIVDHELLVYPNPVSEASAIYFNLATTQDVQLNLIDANGRLVKTLLSGTQLGGQHQVLLTGISLNSGIYFVELETESRKSSLQIIK